MRNWGLSSRIILDDNLSHLKTLELCSLKRTNHWIIWILSSTIEQKTIRLRKPSTFRRSRSTSKSMGGRFLSSIWFNRIDKFIQTRKSIAIVSISFRSGLEIILLFTWKYFTHRKETFDRNWIISTRNPAIISVRFLLPPLILYPSSIISIVFDSFSKLILNNEFFF